MICKYRLHFLSVTGLLALLATGCCCSLNPCGGGCGSGGCKLGGEAHNMMWQGGCGGRCSGGSGRCGCTCGSGHCRLHSAWAAASGWCPDYPAMAAGWIPCQGPIINFFAGIRNAMAMGCFGCGGMYYGEWSSDPPDCQDPCPGAYGPCGSGGGEVPMGETWSSDGSEVMMDGAVTEGSGSAPCNCGGSASTSVRTSGHQHASLQPIARQPAGRRVVAERNRRPTRTVSHEEGEPTPALKRTPARKSRAPRRAEFLEDTATEAQGNWEY